MFHPEKISIVKWGKTHHHHNNNNSNKKKNKEMNIVETSDIIYHDELSYEFKNSEVSRSKQS